MRSNSRIYSTISIFKEDKPMTIRIHPAEKAESYEELLLALLTQANLPALTGEFSAAEQIRTA